MSASLPQKKFFRQRAHSNPIADHILDYPVSPDNFDWHAYFPEYIDTENVQVQNVQDAKATVSSSKIASDTTGDMSSHDEPASKKMKRCVNTSEKEEKHKQGHVNFLDVGCGYGGLLVELSPMFPDKLILGMEIRVKVSTYVQERIKALRVQHSNEKPGYNNIACIRSNAMKHLPNFFNKGQIEKMFFLFPDPHFKKQKHKWRIISPQLLTEYAYVLAIGARVYLATDVKDLYDWMVGHFNDHPLFHSVDSVSFDDDPVVSKLFDSTEEGKKVTRNGGQKFIAVYVRIDDPYNKSQ